MNTTIWFVILIVILQHIVGWAGIGLILTAVLFLCTIAGFDAVRTAWYFPEEI